MTCVHPVLLSSCTCLLVGEQYSKKSEDHLRYMKYSKYTPEENLKINAWVRGHTGARPLLSPRLPPAHQDCRPRPADLGSWTLLFRQPVAALQIRDHVDGQWRWVKPQDATITVNACDALTFLTGGYVKSTIHRVVVPPRDQQHVDRLGLLYFSRCVPPLAFCPVLY
jgi:isopenicillin N synthase-like dioxygenase